MKLKKQELGRRRKPITLAMKRKKRELERTRRPSTPAMRPKKRELERRGKPNMINMKQPKPTPDNRMLMLTLCTKPRKRKSEQRRNLRRPTRCTFAERTPNAACAGAAISVSSRRPSFTDAIVIVAVAHGPPAA